MAGRTTLMVVAALVVLAAILAVAGVLRDSIEIAYEESGNGCRTLSDDDQIALQLTLLPVRGLLIAWVIVTGLWIFRSAGRAGPVDSDAAAVGGVVLLAIAQMFFVAIDLLVAMLPLVAIWILGLVVLVYLVNRAVVTRGTPTAPWYVVAAGWLLLVAGALPVALLALTEPGSILSC